MTKHSLSSSGALLAMTLALAAAGCGGGTPTSPTPPPNACVFAISPASIVVTSAGQAVTIHIDTTASCAWTARTDAGWISLSAISPMVGFE